MIQKEKSMKIYCMSDIHGCYSALCDALELVIYHLPMTIYILQAHYLFKHSYIVLAAVDIISQKDNGLAEYIWS